ncbi:hypothetical protein M3Y94_01229800 [Aphelenchoides besseyi]|nr:hypothetical protein M3Y94_01229800 [Aphelenchoides besseyi]
MAAIDVVKKTLISIPVIHFGCILFGAPFLYDFVVTLMFSTWLSLIGILPLMLATNAQFNAFMSVVFERKTITVTQKIRIVGSNWQLWWSVVWIDSCAVGLGSLVATLAGSLCYWLSHWNCVGTHVVYASKTSFLNDISKICVTFLTN